MLGDDRSWQRSFRFLFFHLLTAELPSLVLFLLVFLSLCSQGACEKCGVVGEGLGFSFRLGVVFSGAVRRSWIFCFLVS